jgi:hypothetical protein
MYIVLLKCLAKPEGRHSERSEESLILVPDSRLLAPFNVAMPTSYKSNPQNYKCNPRKSQKMNAKYAFKANSNPNKADLSRQVVPNPFTGERPADFSRRLCRLHIFLLEAGSWFLEAVFPKTNPIFSRPNMHYQYQNRRNGGQKTTQKNETNPILTGA